MLLKRYDRGDFSAAAARLAARRRSPWRKKARGSFWPPGRRISWKKAAAEIRAAGGSVETLQLDVLDGGQTTAQVANPPGEPAGLTS